MTNTTTAAVLVETGKPLELMTLTLPDLKPGQVLVELAYTGVCQSQLNEISGRKGPDRYLPHTLGHEGSGTVLEIGLGVSKVSPGDRVVLSWLKGSGVDVPGTTYQSDIGIVNSGAISTFMNKTVTCENRLTRLPSAVPLREAALLGCAIPTGAGIVMNSLRLQPGEGLAVFGLGGVGLSALLAGAAMGATPLIAVDVVPEKLVLAQSLGATHVLDARSVDPVAAVREITGGAGIKYAVEATGRTSAMEAAFEAVRGSDGVCVIAGNAAHGETIQLNPFSLIAGKRIVGSWGGDAQMDQDVERYSAMFADGRLPLGKLISAEYPLTEINRAFDDLKAARVARALVAI